MGPAEALFICFSSRPRLLLPIFTPELHRTFAMTLRCVVTEEVRFTVTTFALLRICDAVLAFNRYWRFA